MIETNSDDFLKRFGKNLKKIRAKKGISLRELAASCNVDHSNIGKIEKGEFNITLLTILELSKGLEIHPKKLLDFDIEE